jgi:hypothetical protein
MALASGLPNVLQINAWTGNSNENRGAPGTESADWVQGPAPSIKQVLAAPQIDLRDVHDTRVGWGLIIKDRPERPAAENATLADMPDPLRKLLDFRKGVVLGWSCKGGTDWMIRYLEKENTTAKVPIADVDRGKGGPQSLPRYLLIFGGPREIPWRVQYALNSYAAVGRLDLDEARLERYVTAVTNDWSGSRAQVSKPLIWSVDKDYDITALMAKTVAWPLFENLKGDAQIQNKARHLTKRDATHARLGEALEQQKPGFIVTTSHGRTEPLSDQDALRRDLGLPVDDLSAKLPLQDLLRAWQPDGAVWYAHACCSAGSDDGTAFAGLFDAKSRLTRTLESVGKLGAQSAPLPVALLGAEKPLRAFIGHVEPTFDLSLRSEETGAALTATLIEALYDNLFLEKPMTVGGAFVPYFKHVGNLSMQLDLALRGIRNIEDDAERKAGRYRIAMLDRRSLVIHGDPAVALPALT